MTTDKSQTDLMERGEMVVAARNEKHWDEANPTQIHTSKSTPEKGILNQSDGTQHEEEYISVVSYRRTGSQVALRSFSKWFHHCQSAFAKFQNSIFHRKVSHNEVRKSVVRTCMSFLDL